MVKPSHQSLSTIIIVLVFLVNPTLKTPTAEVLRTTTRTTYWIDMQSRTLVSLLKLRKWMG